MQGARRSRTGVWTPARLSPEGWWRADLGVSHVSLEVTDWVNQGTEPALDVAQATGSMRPDLVAAHASFNGQDVLHFDGGDLLASAPTSAAFLADDDDLTVISIMRQTTAGLATLIATNNAHTDGGWTHRPRVGSAVQANTFTSGAAANLIAQGPTMSSGVVYAHASVLTGAAAPGSDSLVTLLDGTPGTANTGNRAAFTAAADRSLIIGAINSSALSPLPNGTHVAEILFLKRLLTAPQHAALVAYLNARYGLSLTAVV